MKTQIGMTGAVLMVGMVVVTTDLAFSQPEYLHLVRHRDSNGNLILAPAQSHASHSEVREPAVTPATMSVNEPESHEAVAATSKAPEEPALMADPASGPETSSEAPEGMAATPKAPEEPALLADPASGPETSPEAPEAMAATPKAPEEPALMADPASGPETSPEAPEAVATVPMAQEGTDSMTAMEPLADAPGDSNAETTVPLISESQDSSSVVQKTALPSQPRLFEQIRADWGMSALDVKANQTIPPSWELRTPVLGEFEHRIAYRTRIEGMDTSLSYTFYQDQLAQAKYVFEPQHEDSSNFINDFHAVQDWISRSYGAPTSVQEIWLDNLYQYDKSLWGQALMRGHLVLVSEWKTAESQIALVLNGGDDMVGLVADFSSNRIKLPEPLVEESPSGDTTAPDTTEAQSKPDVSL